MEFSGSLFAKLSADGSTVNILIGSKKFTEGWNSWRVSTMGLMNVGKSEGSEIIQLFGRGVRLKGYGMCLKRSSQIDGIPTPPHIKLLETLNIFGIRARSMQQFKEYLEDEGLPSNEDRIEIILPVVKNLGGRKLKTVRIPDNLDFRRMARSRRSINLLRICSSTRLFSTGIQRFNRSIARALVPPATLP